MVSCSGQSGAPASSARADHFDQLAGSPVEFDIVGKQPRPLDAQALHLGRDFPRRAADLAAISASCRACVARSERCRSSNPASSARSAPCSSTNRCACDLQLFEIGARLFQHLLFHRPRGFLFIEQSLIALLLCRGRGRLPAASRSSSRRATDNRDCARVNSSASLPMLVIQRQRFFLLVLLQRPQALQILAEAGDLAFQLSSAVAVPSTARCFTCTSPVNSRNSRFSASGPLPVFLPPLTACP